MIDSKAFYDCSNICTIIIPKNVTSISDSAFDGCSNLREISVDENNTSYASDSGILYSKDYKRIIIVPHAIQGYIKMET